MSALQYRLARPAEDPRAFRNALGQYGTGVAVVAAEHNGSLLGMTINSFAAVSLDPPLVLWSVRKASQMATAFAETEGFGINVLSEQQTDLSAAFASDESRALAFDKFGWSRGRSGAVLLNGALARFECVPEVVYDGGDHHIIVGRVEQCTVTDGSPLLFVQGEYVSRRPLASLAAEAADRVAAPTLDETTDSFAHVLTAASYRLSRLFDEYRRRSGVTVAQGRVLGRLEKQPMNAEQLAATTFLGRRAIDDAVSDLLARQLVEQTEGDFALTESGRALRHELAEWASELEQRALAGSSDEEIRTTRRVLEALGRP